MKHALIHMMFGSVFTIIATAFIILIAAVYKPELFEPYTVKTIPAIPAFSDYNELTAQILETGITQPDLDDPLLQQRSIIIAGDINAHTTRNVVAKLLFLDKQSPGEPIDLYIKTPGGREADAYAIIDLFSHIQSPVNTHAIGNCESAGAMILAAGTGTRTAAKNSLVMIHSTDMRTDPRDSFNGATRSERRERDFWKRVADLPDDWFPFIRERTYYLSPDQAVGYKVVDRTHTQAEPTE